MLARLQLESVSPTECLLISQICHSTGRYRISSDRVLMHRMLDNILLFFWICNGTTFTVFYMKIFLCSLVGSIYVIFGGENKGSYFTIFWKGAECFLRQWIFLLQVRVLLLFDSKGGLKRERFYW